MRTANHTPAAAGCHKRRSAKRNPSETITRPQSRTTTHQTKTRDDANPGRTTHPQKRVCGNFKPTNPINPQIKTHHPAEDTCENGNPPARRNPQEWKPTNPLSDDQPPYQVRTAQPRYQIVPHTHLGGEQRKLLLLQGKKGRD
ncbi:hypothetical protein BS47DRAFT_1367627 [Hydnum rufescens UP504]|uniref:Uncharacterized protein n=1 Tax=Hydnum rufescens UP504 TaxID=1448309 RepID=A0A9P6AHT5_9AGAM|nr:hypothetical protein BS47DRAFT_1367627 [Hydnum rufescens UP504]